MIVDDDWQDTGSACAPTGSQSARGVSRIVMRSDFLFHHN